jgi:hypothetical protein
MLRIILITLLAVTPCISAENLERDDFIGVWKSDFPTTEGESSRLEIFQNWRVTFTRDFAGNSPTQILTTPPDAVRFIEDLMLIKLTDDRGDLRYKLSLSGWKSESTRALFGTMYMYREGKLFNGLPITFRLEPDDS